MSNALAYYVTKCFFASNADAANNKTLFSFFFKGPDFSKKNRIRMFVCLSVGRNCQKKFSPDPGLNFSPTLNLPIAWRKWVHVYGGNNKNDNFKMFKKSFLESNMFSFFFAGYL